MPPQNKEELRRLVVEGARKTLAEKTWPRVMAIFAYPTPKAPRASDAEFDRLKNFYEQSNCPHIAAFVDHVRFFEKEHSMSMSFSLSLRRRNTPDDTTVPTPENVVEFFSTPDILVGTRGGSEGAAVWLKNFSEAVPQLVPESVQVMDKIFGEVLSKLQEPPASMEELSKLMLSGLTSDVLQPKAPTKH